MKKQNKKQNWPLLEPGVYLGFGVKLRKYGENTVYV